MPRVRHAAGFDPSHIPAIVGTLRNRADIVGYRRQTGPKAVALHPWGTIFVATTEENQRAAEVKALEACSGDPSRGRRGGPCFLYAIGDDVVLGRRFTEAQTAALPTFNEQLVTALTALLPNGSAAARETLARDYEQARTAKALAVLAGRGTWYLEGRANADEAETATLEGCQIFYGQPCALVASGDGVVPRVGTENWPARDMPRVRHAPGFDPAQIPAVTGAARGRADIVGYRGHAGPKAMALHPWGRVFVAAGEENQRAAEAKALEVCNGDPSRGGRGGTCYLYAIGDEVVMARRLTEPQTPAPVVIPVVTPPPPQLGPRELSRAEIVELQKRLQEMGFAPGAADGEVRLSLLEALDAFALAAQMPTATELKLPTLERARLPLSAASRVEALVGLARKALDAQDVGRALRLLEQAPQIASPPSFQVLLMTGEAHAQRGDTAAARIAFEAARKAAGNAREQAQVEGMLGRLVPDVFPPALPGPLGVLAKPGQPGWSVDGRTGCRVWNPDPVASQTMTWTGPCRNANNIAEGEGHLQWRNPAGVTGYRGALSNGVRHGQGLIEFADGNRFESRFNNGRPDGPGTITLHDKTVMKVMSRDGCVREGASLLMNIGRSREACVAQ